MESVNLKLKTQNEKGISVMGYAFFILRKSFVRIASCMDTTWTSVMDVLKSM